MKRKLRNKHFLKLKVRFEAYLQHEKHQFVNFAELILAVKQ